MAQALNTKLISSIWKAFQQLNPKQVSQECERAIRVAVVGSENAIKDAAEFLLGNDPAAYDNAASTLLLIPTPLTTDALNGIKKYDVVLCAADVAEELKGVNPERLFTFSTTEDIKARIPDILHAKELSYAQLPLARKLPAFRAEVNTLITQNISVENAIFVVSTSLGNIIPNPLQPLASLAGSAGDLVVLTANQLRMLFQLAAANNKSIGFKQQSPEIASIIGAAFGWRSAARELSGYIPFGAGIVPKAAIAFAGTWAIGDGISYYYATGKHLTNEQLRERFDTAMEKGKATAESLTAKLKDTYTRFGPLISKPGKDEPVS